MIFHALALLAWSDGGSVVAQVSREERLSSMLCALQPELRWKRGREWTSKECDEAAKAYIAGESGDVPIHALFSMAESIQESDLVDTALRKYGDAYDIGLMGVRHPSMFTKGLKVPEVLKISTNIRVGINQLRYWKQVKLPRTIIQSFKQPDGRTTIKATATECDHRRDHEFFLHYQNGSRVSPSKWHAGYDRRVGAIYLALAARFGEEPWQIQVPSRHGEPAACQKAKKPVGCYDKRTRDLMQMIQKTVWVDPAEPTALADVVR